MRVDRGEKMQNTKWLNTYKISDISGIPYTTARRILLKHATLFDRKKKGRSRLYKVDQIPLLQEINQLYKDGYRRDEIDATMRNSEPETLEAKENDGVITADRPENPPSLYKTLDIISNQKYEIEKHRTQIASMVDNLKHLEEVNKNQSEKIIELEAKMQKMEHEKEKEKSELLKEINQMLFEFMKDNR